MAREINIRDEFSDPTRIFLSGGLGDVLAIESRWSSEFREGLREIHWATSRWRLCKQLFDACPTYQHVKHVVAYDDWQDRACLFQLEDLWRLVPDSPLTLMDWSISRRFPEFSFNHWPFTGSEFLKNKLCDVAHLFPDRPYFLVQADTPINQKDHRDDRRLVAEDWSWILAYLEENDTIAVVVDAPGAGHPPKHERIVDLVGKTNVVESLEILKHAQGYIGIDSWMSVAACQLFEPHSLHIRAVNPWYYTNRHIYAAPYRAWPFVRRNLGKPRPAIQRDCFVVYVLEPILVGDRMACRGERVAVPVELAAKHERLGQVIVFRDELEDDQWP